MENNNNLKKKSFASGLNFFKLFYVFYVGCFLGVVIETIWCRLKNGYFESRTALILEPLNPVYGFGALILALVYYKIKNKKIITIFLITGFIGGAFEYICSLFQEIVYGSVSWIYHEDSLGIFERTSLVYCIFWGILGIGFIKLVYPFLSSKIELIPNKLGVILTYVLLFIFIIDTVFTSCAIFRQNARRKNIPATNFIETFYDKNYNDDVLKKIYPHMTVVR